MTKRADWETQARNWVAWVRTPGHDSYALLAPRFFDDIVPPPVGLTLDLGCGEGRLTRDLEARGHHVVSLDSSPTLIAAAASINGAPRLLCGDAASLPFADASFDLVVAYNVLMDFDDLPGAVLEASRVLRRKGRLSACILHPTSGAGRFESQDPQARFVIAGDYLGGLDYRQTVERDGMTMTFSSFAHPLERYAAALEDAGLLIERLREPAVPPETVEADPSERRWARIPQSLFLRAVKLD